MPEADRLAVYALGIVGAAQPFSRSGNVDTKLRPCNFVSCKFPLETCLSFVQTNDAPSMALLVQVKAEPRKARNTNQFAKLFYQKMRSKRVKIS